MEMPMTQSIVWMFGLMAFLIILVAGMLGAVRVYAWREVKGDHPHRPVEERRALVAAQRLALQGPRDPVEDVGD